MKTFWAALALFAVLLGVVVLNFYHINHVADELNRKLDALPACEEAEEALDEMYRYWEGHKKCASLSVSYEVLYKMEENMTDMRSAMAEEEASEFEKARALMRISIRQMRRLEKFSIENIF